MSTALRIAAVTHVLKDLLNDGLINNNVTSMLGSVARVSSVCPGQLDGGGDEPPNQLNIFLHRVSLNSGWNNLGFPTRNPRGDRVSAPPLALDLHYLLTAFGTGELDGEVLLGYGMQVLYETPVLDRSAIRDSLSTTNVSFPNDLQQQLAQSRLEEQLEQIKITHEPTTTEEMSKLWSTFQTRYRPCAAYLATVVLLEPEVSVRPGLPVTERRVFALPFRYPRVERVLSQAGAVASEPVEADRRVVMGDRIFVRGRDLAAEGVTVRINGTDLVPAAPDVAAREISLVLAQPGGTAPPLRAGVQGLQVVQPLRLTLPPSLSETAGGLNVTPGPAGDRGTNDSNVAAFVLCPAVTVDSSNATPNGTRRDLDLTVSVVPDARPGQRVALLLNQSDAGAGAVPAAYSVLLPAEDLTAPAASLTFHVEGMVAGDYLVRLQIDGAESPLSRAADGTFTGPSIHIP